MYAIIATGGKQYKVEEGDVIKVEKLGVEAGETVTFDQVLVVSDKETKVGTPTVAGASVTATVVSEGKAKKVFATDDPELLIVSYKDDATAFNGLKKGTIVGKGVINNRMSNLLMQHLEKAGIPTHFVEELSDRETLVKKVSIVPLEVIIRNIAAGSFSGRYGVEEGFAFETPTIEFSYKNDELGDPLMDEYHAVAMKLATKEEIETIKKYAFGVNEQLKAFWRINGESIFTALLCLEMFW